MSSTTDPTPSTTSPPKQLRAFHITLPSALSSKDIEVFDIPLSDSNDKPLGALAESLFEAHNTASHPSTQSAHLTLHRPSKLSSKHDVRDSPGRTLAIWDAPLLGFGKSSLTFPNDSPYADAQAHDLSEITGRGQYLRGVQFSKANVGYAWETEGDSKGKGRHCFALRKTVAGEKREIGFCYQQTGYGRVAVVVLDEAELDSLVGVVTCVAALEKSDSFTK